MNTIISNSSYACRSTQQTDRQKHARSRNVNLESTVEQFYGDVGTANTKDSDISVQEVYERMGGLAKTLPEAEQDDEYMDKSIGESDVKRSPSSASLDGETHVTEIGVVSLPSGVSFYFNEDTGEVSCVNDRDSRPGKQILWNKILSPEELVKCDKMFENYKDIAAGCFVCKYRAYLPHEEFWDMYLEGKVDLAKLTESDDTLSEEELYRGFLRDMASKETVKVKDDIKERLVNIV